MLQLLPAAGESAVSEWKEAVSEPLAAVARHTVTFLAEEQVVSRVYLTDGALLDQLPDAPETEGKRFIGWYSDLAAVSAETIVTGDMTVSAVYTDVDADLEARKAGARFLYEDAGKYASVSIFGSYNGNQRPSAAQNTNVLGAEVLEAWTANNIRNNTSLTLEAVITALPEGRTLSAYTVIDDQAVRLVASGLTLGDRVTFDLVRSGAKGIALTAD
ncbi:MAG: InlB B-repeat-containing protein, partial [Clostridia bacterium]|nr:InlB B-repeat-containing protein [Clostridia bacterium]